MSMAGMESNEGCSSQLVAVRLPHAGAHTISLPTSVERVLPLTRSQYVTWKLFRIHDSGYISQDFAESSLDLPHIDNPSLISRQSQAPENQKVDPGLPGE